AGRARAVGVALALVGSGLGYVVALLHQPAGLEALDLHLPELSGFYSVLAIPHFAWAAALMALSLTGLMRVAAGSGTVALTLTTPAMLALTAIHPQMLFVLAPLAAFQLVVRPSRARTWLLSAIPFLICAPLVLYYLRVLTGDPVVVAWSRQWKHQA